MDVSNLHVRTRTKNSSKFKYESDVINTIVFLRHSSDKICIRSGSEAVQIDVYYNDELLFSGDKLDFFEQLKKS